jgi:small subunit ribosomal protein S4
VRHGHFTVNGRRLSIPSARVKKGDVVALTERGKKAARIEEALAAVDARGLPAWLAVDKDQKTGEIIGDPAREEITLPIQEQLIVELYSR